MSEDGPPTASNMATGNCYAFPAFFPSFRPDTYVTPIPLPAFLAWIPSALLANDRLAPERTAA